MDKLLRAMLSPIAFSFIVLTSFAYFSYAVKFKPDFYDFRNIKDIVFESITDESVNWTKNQACFNELQLIKTAFTNADEWAIEMLDAWGNFPSGTMRGNFFDLGSFSQCFHIERNEKAVKTQYCIGQLKVRGQIDMNTVKPQLDVGPGVSIGLCLPSVCSVDHLTSLVDRVVRKKSSKMTFFIPQNTCQFEENVSGLGSLDLIVIGMFGVALFLVALSTSYDLFQTMNARDKYQPLLAFSLYTNGLKLFSCETSSSSDQIECLHGIRSIITIWLVLAHSFTMYAWLPIQFRVTAFEFLAMYRSTLIPSAHAIIDSFLVLSGLLISFNMLKYLKRNGSESIPYGLLYLNRYLRMTPMLAIYMLVSMTLIRFMGNGPIWPISLVFLSDNCKRYWWSTLLHIQNYVNPGEICMANTWYISVDMQLFFIAPFIILCIHRYNKKALAGLLLLIFGCVGLTLVVHLKYNLTTLLENRKIEIAYFPTHMRYSSWLVGIILGYIFAEYPKGSIRIPKILNLFGWTLSFAAMAVVILATYPLHTEAFASSLTPLHYGLYDGLSRVFWATALCYIIFACAYGSGGLVNWFLSHPRWLPLSKLSYCICLFHYPLIIFIMFTAKNTPHFDDVIGFHGFIANYVLSIFVAIVMMLVFETPLNNIQKLIFDGHQRKQKQVQTVKGQKKISMRNSAKKDD